MSQVATTTTYTVKLDNDESLALYNLLDQITRLEGTKDLTKFRDEFSLSSEDWIHLNVLRANLERARDNHND